MSVFDGIELGRHILSSGKESNIKFVIERMLEFPEDRAYVVHLLEKNTSVTKQPLTIAGIAAGGALVAGVWAQQSGLRLIVIDKSFVPSRPPRFQNEPVLVVDDVVTTGTSVQKAMKNLTDAGFNVVGYTFVIDRRDMGNG